MRVSNFRMKVSVLYELASSPQIRNTSDLAKALQLSPTAVRKWLDQDKLPTGRVQPFCNLFGITTPDLTADLDRSAFRLRVAPDIDQAWKGLIECGVVASPALTIERPALAIHRDLAFEPPIDEPAERVQLGETIQFRVDWEAGWTAVLLLSEPSGYRVLCPSDIERKDKVPAECHLLVPSGAYLRVVPPVGMHCLVALLRRDPWPGGFYEFLTDKSTLREAMQIALHDAKSGCVSVLTKQFVSVGSLT